MVSLTVAARAGPRYEPAEGVAHALKNFAFRSTDTQSALRIVRESELNGASLSAALNKEHLLLTAEFLKGDENHFAGLLADVVGSSKYNKFEFKEDVVPSMAADAEVAAHDPVVHGLESLLATAYRNRGVGSPLFASPSAPVKLGDVKSFASKALTRANLAVVSSGLTSQQLESLVASNFAKLPGGESLEATPSKYYGGDFRAPIADAHGHALPQDHFFIAFEGAPRAQSPTVAVLEALLGGVSSVKWSHGLTPLARASQQMEGSNLHSFSASFQDTGLFGLHIAAPSSKVTDASKLAVQTLQHVASGAPSAEDTAKAIANAKFKVASQVEGSRAASHETAAAALLGNSSVSLDEKFAALEGVSGADLSALADRLLKSKPTTAALGALKQLPFADDLL